MYLKRQSLLSSKNTYRPECFTDQKHAVLPISASSVENESQLRELCCSICQPSCAVYI